MGSIHEFDRLFNFGADENSPGRLVEVIETGTGLFNSDLVTVYDASLPPTQDPPIPEHITDLNSYVTDNLDSAPPSGIQQTEIKTNGNSLLRIRKAVGAAATAVVTGLGGV